MFAKCLQNVCEMFAECLRNVCRNLAGIFSGFYVTQLLLIPAFSLSTRLDCTFDTFRMHRWRICTRPCCTWTVTANILIPSIVRRRKGNRNSYYCSWEVHDDSSSCVLHLYCCHCCRFRVVVAAWPEEDWWLCLMMMLWLLWLMMTWLLVANPNSCIRFPKHRRRCSCGVVGHCGDCGGIIQEIPLTPATTTTKVLQIATNFAAVAIICKL